MHSKPHTPGSRVLAVLLALTMLLSASSLTVLAQDADAASSPSSSQAQSEPDSSQPTAQPDPTPEQTAQPSAAPTQEPAAEETPAPTGEFPTDGLKTVEKVPLEEIVNDTQSPGNTTYYVDVENGSDSNTGISPDSAWQTLDKVNSFTFAPGDTIRLKSGCSWNGVLAPKGNGAEGNPITISSYGEGSRPIINGGGTSGPAITGAVLIYNQEYWEIENLEVTNLEPTDKPGETMDSGTAERAGILIYSSIQDRVLKHVRVRNCYVHDVNSNYKGGKTSGGIIVMGHYMDIDGNVVTIDDEGNLTPHAMGRAAFEDVIIENNYVKNVAIEGIRNKCNTNINSDGWGRNEFLKNYKNVIIRNNYIEDVVGDGIVLTEVKGGAVEGNIVKNSCGFDRGNVNYAQCWTMFADDVVVQYNEVYGNRYGYDDGEAFDSDMKNERNVFQYNLSHDNGGGVCLFMSSQTDTTFRYNVSINDGAGTYPNGSKMRQQTFHYDSTSSDGPNVPKIYNNTIYVSGEDNSTVLFGGKSARTCFINFKNNIVLAENGANVTFSHDDSTIHADSVVENNCFWPASIADSNGMTGEALAEKGNIFADPMLADPAAGLDYTSFSLPVEEMDKLPTLARERVVELSRPYQLQEGSPCIRAGQMIAGAPETDLFGNPVAGLVDIGAHELSSTPETGAIVRPVTVATLVGKLPVLPDTVEAEIDGSTYTFAVEWEEITPDQVAEEGTLQVQGTVNGVAQPAEATVYVVSSPSKPIEVEPVTTRAGQYPALPATVTAQFENEVTLELPVEWEILSADQFTKAGTYTVKGKVKDLEQGGDVTVKVTVTGSVDPTAETVVSVTTGDTYIQESPATTNYNGKRMEVKLASPGYHRRALMQFDLSGLTEEQIASAQKIELRLYGVWAQEDGKWNTGTGADTTRWVDLYGISTDWDESKVNWSTQPALGENILKEFPLVNRDIDQKNFTLDVTDYVHAQGADKLGILLGIFSYGEYGDADNNGFAVASKESAGTNEEQKPALVLSYTYLESIVPVELEVPAGEEAQLPETVTVRLSDGSEEQRAVVWESFQLPAEGESVQVRGAVEGTAMPAVAEITVTAPLPEITAVAPIEPLRAMLGTPEDQLGLPATATATLDNGQTVELPVGYWFPEPAYDPYVEQTYTWVGYFDLENSEIKVNNSADLHPSVQTQLVWQPNKSILQEAIAAAEAATVSGEVNTTIVSVQKEFAAAYQAALKAMNDEMATVEEVQAAYNGQQIALWKLGYTAADKTTLNELIKRADELDLGIYTDESAAAVTAALESAKALQADGELSVADQPAVDEAAAALKAALEALEEKDPATPTPNPTEKPTPEPTQPPVPTPDPDPSAVPSPTSTPDTGDAGQIPATGDSVAVTALAVLLAAALAGVCGFVILKKRKQ